MRESPQDSHKAFAVTLRGMQSWRSGATYYAITLLATADRRTLWSVQSNWVGPSQKYPGWERRQAAEVLPDIMTSLWEELGQPWVAAHSDAELALWIRIGGNALVEHALAWEHLAHWVEPRECAPDGPIGFQIAESLDARQLRRRTSRGVGKQVNRRDGNCCVRCGRGQVSLAKHHVLPRSSGGLTQASNLVTLCLDCHEEMDKQPNHPVLFGLLLEHEMRRLGSIDEEHRERVRRHRILIADRVGALSAAAGVLAAEPALPMARLRGGTGPAPIR